jgi:hypothetical protein
MGHGLTQQTYLAVIRQQGSQHFQQRGFTGAVGPNDAGPATNRQRQVNTPQYFNISEASPYGVCVNSY